MIANKWTSGQVREVDKLLVNSSTRQLVHPSTYHVTLSFFASNLSTRQLIHSSTYHTSNLFTRQLVNSSPRQLNSSNPGSKLSSRDC